MKFKILNVRNVLALMGVLSQIVIYVFILAYMLINIEARIKKIDYLVIYTAGYIVHFESPARLYDLDLQQNVQKTLLPADQLPNFYPYNHPPFLAPVLGLVTNENYVASYFRWMLVLLLFYSIGLTLLLFLFHSMRWRASDLWLLGLSGFLFYPVFASYLKGQDSAFLMLGISAWTLGLFTGRDRLAGLGLALAAIRPQVALALALPFLFRRRKVWWWFVIGGLILFAYNYLLVGAQGLLAFIHTLFMSGQGFGFDAYLMINLKGALLRLFPAIEVLPLNIITYGGYVLAIISLCFLWAKTRTVEFKNVGLAVLIGMLFSPHIHYHDWSLLLIPSLAAVVVLSKARMLSRDYAVLIPMGVSIYILFFHAFVPSSLAIYLLIFGLGILLWLPDLFEISQGKRKKCQSVSFQS